MEEVEATKECANCGSTAVLFGGFESPFSEDKNLVCNLYGCQNCGEVQEDYSLIERV